MAQPVCGSCQQSLLDDDSFCGSCGSPVRPAGPTAPAGAAFPPDPGATAATWGNGSAEALSGRFFRHAPGRPAGPPSNATRYLCAAAYLDPAFANRVIRELVASRRAVAPSIGIDLGPIIRHCLNARRIAVTRDIVFVIVLVGGLVFVRLPTVAVLFFGALFSLESFLRDTRRPLVLRALVALGFMLFAGVIAVVATTLPLGTIAGIFDLAQLGVVGRAVASSVLIYLLVAGGTMFVYTWHKYRILAGRLQQGAPPFAFPTGNVRTEARITEVEAAQWGNVALYGTQNPFLGAGEVARNWSITIELGRVPIDPVELHNCIRERLLRLNDPTLPDNERISSLIIHDHIVGEGQRRWDGPLVDVHRNVPYSEASAEAVAALIRHPQAGLRYYQRISVSDAGQAVLCNGQPVIGSADQEIAVSAFVYVAVEGRMLYLEFVTTALPPVHRHYHIINLLSKMTSVSFVAMVLRYSAHDFLPYLFRSPYSLSSTLRLRRQERRLARQTTVSPDDYLIDGVGALLSVRELGASESMHTYIQDLDAHKYTKIIERLLTETVLDFLVGKQVDVTAYRASASTIINNSLSLSGGMVAGLNMGNQAATANIGNSPATSR